MKCSNCGAENDAANRFCDQCGAALAQPTAQPAIPVAISAGLVCPQCGAVALPGEAFCDNCGSALAQPAPVFVAAPEAAPAAVVVPVETTAVPVLAESDLTPPALPDPVPTVAPMDATVMAPVAPVVPITVTPDPAPVPIVAPLDATVMAPVAPAVPVTITPDPVPVAPVAPAVDTQTEYAAEHSKLEAEVARQQQILTQLEAVQAMLGVATPAGVLQSLDEARTGLQAAQQALATLQPPAPAVDPALVAALSDEIARQRQIVTQLNAVQVALGVATPAGVLQSLSDAQTALQTAEQSLAALGVTAVPAAPVVPAAPAMPSPDAPTMVAPPPALPTAPTIPTVPAEQPVAAPPPPAGPRFVLQDSGKEIVLPVGKSEIIIGREDPISGIYPEVDMTPHGGEGGGVSRQHAKLQLQNGQWMLIDLNSTNHTKINGTRLEPNIATAVPNGATLQFGRLSMVFKLS